MPCGIQCWDASGKLIVDVGDYNTRFLGRTTINLAASSGVSSQNFSGLTAAGTFASVISSSSPNLYPNNFATRTYDGGFRVWRLSTNPSAVDLTVDLFAFI